MIITRPRGILVQACLIFLLTALFPLGSSAKESSEEELAFTEIEDVFSAAKHLQRIQDAPASVTVITDEEISRYGHRNLTDVVKNVRSFYTYSDRNYDYIGVRGFGRLGDYGNRVLQLVDGHPYNENIYGAVFMNASVDMDTVKKIEFIRGPGSALYGSNALLGTVNIITKNGKDFDGWHVKAEAESYDTLGGGLIYGKEFENNVDLLLSARFQDSRGQDHYYAEFDTPPASNGWARNTDGKKKREFFLKAKSQEVSFTASMGWQEKTVPTASYATVFNDDRFKTVDEREFAEIKWEHSFDIDRTIMTRVYYDRYFFKGDYPVDVPPITINRDEALGQWIGTELNYSHKIASSRLLIGGEAAYHMDANQKNFDVEPFADYLNDNRSFSTWSTYLQDEWDITSKLHLVAGIRYDHYSTFGEHLSPRVGFIMQPASESAIKLLYGQAFRAPNVYELYYHYSTTGSVYKTNPDLKPEILHTYEAVWEQEWGPITKSTVSAFHYVIQDLITQIQDPVDSSLQYQNLARAKSDGIEAGVEITWPDILKAHFSYTYQDTRDDSTRQRLPNSPYHLAKAGATLPVYRNILFLAVQCRYMSSRLDRDGESVSESFVTDLNLSAKNIVKGLGLSFGIYNAFDENYSDPVSSDHTQKIIRQDGRSYRFQINYSF